MRETDAIHELLDQLPVSFWMSRGREANYEIVLWNEGAARIYGFSKQEALGASFIDLFVDEPQKDQAREDADRIIAGLPLVVPAVNCIAIDRDKDGNPVALLTNAFRVEFREESFQAEIATDLTPSRFLEYADTYYRAKREGPKHAPLRTLEAFLEHVTELNARQLALWGRTFAHEIRSELYPLRQALRQLSMNYRILRETDEFNDIERALNSLRLLSDNFLAFQARFAHGGGLTNPQYFAHAVGFDLVRTVREVVGEFVYAASLVGAGIDVGAAGGLEDIEAVRLLGTREAFSNTIRNVLSNALKHYDRSSSAPGTPVSVELIPSKTYVTVLVKNPGHIDEAQIEHGFEPFFKDARNPSEGMHLGLSIAYQWTEEVGGNISIENVQDMVVVKISWPRDAHEVGPNGE